MSKGLRLVPVLLVVGLLGLSFATGCESDAQSGAGLGALAGAGIGALAGGDTKSTLIGAAVGGGVGYGVGNEQDKKKMKTDIAAAQQAANTMVVNITNSNGSITPVTIRCQGNVWVGPKGEQYPAPPTVEQLKPVYGF